MNHSPLPWRWTVEDGWDDNDEPIYVSIDPLNFRSDGYGNNPVLRDANNEPVISGGHGEYTPWDGANNAVFILEACNNYERLLNGKNPPCEGPCCT